MGGVADWRTTFPANGCNLSSPFPPCKWWCDPQSCDQCHPDDVGYHQLASVVFAGLNTSGAFPPTPPGPPPKLTPGVWLFEDGGTGKTVLSMGNFTPNTNSNRNGTLAWDACRAQRTGGVFDNGHPLWSGTGAHIGAVQVSCALAVVATLFASVCELVAHIGAMQVHSACKLLLSYCSLLRIGCSHWAAHSSEGLFLCSTTRHSRHSCHHRDTNRHHCCHIQHHNHYHVIAATTDKSQPPDA
jgi:hypothetical protein